MKRIGYLYEKICDIANIKTAILKSSLGKRSKGQIKEIVDNIDHYALQIQMLLAEKTYLPSPYEIKVIKDGPTKKERTISKPKYYPDQIIHWALMLQLQPVIMRGMYEYSCGSVPGRGTSHGQKTLRKWLDRDYAGTKYCLKMDISKFYPSIDLSIIKNKFREVVKDPDCLWLIDQILNSNENGVPIGNYTSQWFSNYFLQGLDHFIKEDLRVRYYIRYVDDLVLLGPNKKVLRKAKGEIDDYLAEIGLKIKRDWQIFQVNKRAIDFLGFRFFRSKTILRKRNALRIRRRLAKIARKHRLSYLDACALVSYWGWIKRSDSYRFYEKYLKGVISIKKARKVISDYGKEKRV